MSDGEAATIADVAPDVPRVVVPFGLDLGRYVSAPPAAEFRQRYLGNEDAPLVVNVGRLAEKKGLDVLVRAFGRVVRHVPDARLALVGPDDENLMGPLQAIAEAEGVASHVVFTGLLTGRDKLAALAAADVWALPSRSEAFPMAVLEALAMGCPAVITPAVNNAADVEAAGAALVVEPEPEPFGGALAELLTDPDRRAALRERARAFAENYDLPKVAPQWAATYARVSGRG
jgi:glycosyltransferase involved in cell wall biosynthesis